MASGLTLVSSGVGGASELFVDNESGLKFKPGNADDLANKLKMLCEDPKKMCELASRTSKSSERTKCNGTKKLENVFWEKSKNQILEY